MKKCVKKIPKYGNGIPGATAPSPQEQFKSMNARVGGPTSTSGNGNIAGGIAGAIGAASGAVANAFGIEQGKNAAIFNAVGDVASMIPGVGQFLGPALKTVGAFAGEGGGVDQNTGEVTKSSGLTRVFGWGRDDKAMAQESNRIKMANASRTLTENLRTDYYNNTPGAGSINVLAAEGGIMRQPVDALVSPGEIAIDPYTLEYEQFGSSNEEPNSKDNISVVLEEGTIVKSHAKHMKMPNGKTPADNSKMVLDSNISEEMKRKMIKKINNWESAHRTKPQEYAKFDGGGIVGINKYGYNKNMSDFAYWDKDRNEYKKEYLDWVNNLTEQDVRDIESGKYGDMSEYFSKNKGKKLDVATAQKLMTDKKYGNWHKIGKMFVDSKISNLNDAEHSIKPASVNLNKLIGVKASDASDPITNLEKDLMRPIVPEIEGKNYWGRALKRNLPKIGQAISDLSPILATLFDDYDYHTEHAQISPAKYIPTGVNIDPIRRAADESYAMARYNQANISPNTGAGMAYGLQAASNRTKSLTDAYVWQQDAQNKLIAQNAGIYNDWAKRYDAARYQATADTRANEGAAQQMRDQAIKDAYEFQTGRRNDRWKLSMLEPLMKYAVDDNIWKNFKIA